MNNNNLLEKTNTDNIQDKNPNINTTEVTTAEKISDLQPQTNTNISPTNIPSKKNSILKISIITFFIVLLLTVVGFHIYTLLNSNIVSNVYVYDINISNMDPSDAKYLIDSELEKSIPTEIFLKYNNMQSTISTEQLKISFDTSAAIEEAYSIGKSENSLQNTLNTFLSFFKTTKIVPDLSIDSEQLSIHLNDLSTKLPDTVIESSYYIEGNDLIVTTGKSGNVIDIDTTIESIKNSAADLSFNSQSVEITTIVSDPTPVDIDAIYSEIFKSPVDAYYTQEPFAVYPSENGLDFSISLEEARNLIASGNESEYIIPLKTTYPNVTTNMIGSEAFPDLLATHSSTYNIYDNDRTTNVILSSNKINGVVVMPGETFSYNKIVGERTISAGYKEASIYVNGEVVDGLGGGICQVTSNLYNAVLYSNLGIVERANHQFIPPYSSASRDATVVYGLIDFQFKNTRNYPIKIYSTVSNGTATVQIYGLKEENEYDVQIKSYQTGSTSTAIYSESYRILSQNGTIISSELLSKDTYKK